MDSKIIRLLLFFFLLPINSYATEFQGSFKQGSFILGKTNKNSEVYIDKKKVRVTKDGYFAFGIGRDRKNNILIKIINDGKTEIIEKKVFKKKYIIQRIDGLPPKQVTPPKEVYDRIRATQLGEEERQRLALEERLASQGRLGVQTAMFGGTPEQLALAKAQESAQNQASLMAMQQAQQELVRLTRC